MRHVTVIITLALALIFHSCSVEAQSATPTMGVLVRTLVLQSQYFRGTAFSIDVDNREYWITAKHMLTGAKHPPFGSIAETHVTLKLLDPSSRAQKWLTIPFTVIDTEKDVDIVVLAAASPVLNHPVANPKPEAAATMGADCEFLGFPYGGGWLAPLEGGKTFWMPYMKRCSVSGLTTEPQKIWILDGINNEGFSGGPVLFQTGADQRIFAVVSGYTTEPAEVVPMPDSPLGNLRPDNSPRTKERVDVNSGFIIAFDISYAIAAIHSNPIGPLRPAE
jgi:hypothetical protein